jgi:hypothetical protein
MSARTVSTPKLNNVQSSLVPGGVFTHKFNDSSTVAPTALAEASNAYTYDGATGVYTITSATLAAIKPGAFTFTPRLQANTSSSATAGTLGVVGGTAGSVVTQGIATALASKMVTTIVGSANVSDLRESSTAAPQETGTSSVRLGTADADIKVTLLDADDKPVGANREIQVTAASQTPAAGYTINGVAISAPVVLKTDAAGSVTIKVGKVAPAVAGNIVLTMKTTAPTPSGIIFDHAVTLQWVAAAYQVYDVAGVAQVADNGIADNVSISASESVAFTVGYHDQWNVSAPADTHRVRVASVGSASNGAEQFFPLTSGAANFSVTSNGQTQIMGTTSPAITTTIAVQKLTGTTWADISAATQTVGIFVYSAGTRLVATAPAAANVQADDAVIAWDNRVSQTLRPAYSNNKVTLTGTIRDGVTDIARSYAQVKISGDSAFAFSSGDFSSATSVDRKASTTVVADVNGDFTVYIYSNKSVSSSDVTVVAGGTTTSVKVTFSTPAATAATSLVATAATSIKAGRTANFTFTAQDKWGNTVLAPAAGLAAVSSSSRGFSIATVPTAGLAVYSAQVLLQQLDRGPIVVSASHTATAGVLRATAATWAGPAVNATAGAVKGRIVIESYRAKGKTVNVFVGSTRVATFTPDTTNDRFVVKGVKSGTRNVSVRIVGPGYDFPTSPITVK